MVCYEQRSSRVLLCVCASFPNTFIHRIFVRPCNLQFAHYPYLFEKNKQTSNLGIDDVYFGTETVETIANHIMALYGAKIFAYTKNENEFDINLERETDEGAVYIHTSRPGVSQAQGPQHERRYVYTRTIRL